MKILVYLAVCLIPIITLEIFRKYNYWYKIRNKLFKRIKINSFDFFCFSRFIYSLVLLVCLIVTVFIFYQTIFLEGITHIANPSIYFSFSIWMVITIEIVLIIASIMKQNYSLTFFILVVLVIISNTYYIYFYSRTELMVVFSNTNSLDRIFLTVLFFIFIPSIFLLKYLLELLQNYLRLKKE